ncbi:MAG: PTS sugar transporter subunit IIA [Desulfomonilia bacterium]|jgi:PTS system nitrogen regulatory IIA component
MKISDILKPECVLSDIRGATKKDILTELSRPIAGISGVNPDEMAEVLLNREKLGSTGIGEGVAIPHGKIAGLRSILASIGRSREGLAFDSLDGKPCHIFFLLAAPGSSVSGHLKALARASMLLKNPDLRKRLIDADTAEEIYRVIIEYDDKLDE